MPKTKITTSGYRMVFQIGLLCSAKIDPSLLALIQLGTVSQQQIAQTFSSAARVTVFAAMAL